MKPRSDERQPLPVAVLAQGRLTPVVTSRPTWAMTSRATILYGIARHVVDTLHDKNLPPVREPRPAANAPVLEALAAETLVPRRRSAARRDLQNAGGHGVVR